MPQVLGYAATSPTTRLPPLLLSAARQEEPESLRSIRVRAHALRHTFGVHSTAAEIPLDVTQQILGHASIATTTIYVQGDRKRRLREIGKLYRANR